MPTMLSLLSSPGRTTNEKNHCNPLDQIVRNNGIGCFFLRLFVLLPLMANLVLPWVDILAVLKSEFPVAAVDIDMYKGNSTISATTSSLVVPNFLLAGAPKAGTSAVAKWLYFGGYGICTAKRFNDEKIRDFQKEVHFFDNNDRFKRGIAFYASIFSECTSSDLVMDATPDYGIHANRIRHFYRSRSLNLASPLGGLKVILILREPVARELSWYNHKMDMYFKDQTHTYPRSFWLNVVKDERNRTVYSFDEYVDEFLLQKQPSIEKAKDPSCRGTMCKSVYSIQLQQWFEWMPRDRMLILSYQELMTDPTISMKRIEDFLGLPHMHHEEFDKTNTHSHPNKTALPSCQIRDKLTGIFQPWNEALYDLLARNPGPPMEQRPFPKFEPAACQD